MPQLTASATGRPFGAAGDRFHFIARGLPSRSLGYNMRSRATYSIIIIDSEILPEYLL
jgi:hypothetical protein